MSYEERDDFEPLAVLQLSSTTPAVTKEWIVQRLTASRHGDDGAGLLARFESSPENRNSLVIIGATTERLLAGAEELRIQKWDKTKGLTDFLVADIEHFENAENPGDILFKSEKQRIIYEEIENLRPMKHEHAVPGVPTKSFNSENDTIMRLLNDLNFLVNFFPLHDKEDIKLIEHDWFKSKYSIFKSQDIHKIRNYFGDSVAFYFAFLEYYTKALIPTSILGKGACYSDVL